MTVKDIVKKYLVSHGYDGLFSPVCECGCDLGEDFMACDGPCDECKPGYKIDDPDGEYLYLIVAEKDDDT